MIQTIIILKTIRFVSGATAAVQTCFFSRVLPRILKGNYETRMSMIRSKKPVLELTSPNASKQHVRDLPKRPYVQAPAAGCAFPAQADKQIDAGRPCIWICLPLWLISKHRFDSPREAHITYVRSHRNLTGADRTLKLNYQALCLPLSYSFTRLLCPVQKL